jgi:hypothetical protein
MRPSILPIAAAVLTAALAGSLACRPKTVVPQWVATMPAGARFAFSSELGWALEHKGLQGAIAHAPQVGQMLDLFLSKARINPQKEAGRLTLYLLNLPTKVDRPQDVAGAFLIQLSGFRDPKALQQVVTESFPPEGFLKAGGADWPLFVVMDFAAGGNQIHFRVASDPSGGLWLGDLSALSALAHPRPLSDNVLSAAGWLSPHQKLQGALRPQGLLEGLKGQLPGEWAQEPPSDLDILLWGVTPGEAGQPWQMEAVVGGTPDAVGKVAPWLQRFGAALDATRPQGQAPAQLLQERTRAGLRASVDETQLEAALQRLGIPNFKLRDSKAK